MYITWRKKTQLLSPVDDELASEVVQRQPDLADVVLNALGIELDPLQDVVAEVAAEEEVDDHEHVFLVLEGEPEVDQERVLQGLEDLLLPQDVADRVLLDAHGLIHVLHGKHLLGVPLLDDAYLDMNRKENSGIDLWTPFASHLMELQIIDFDQASLWI